MRYVGAASGVKPKRQLRRFVLRRNAATPGLTCDSTSTGGKLALMPYAGFPFEREVVDPGGMEVEDVELVARRQARDARQRDAVQRPRPRHLREAADASAEHRRLLRQRVRREVGRHAQARRVDPLRVGDDRELRRHVVAEEMHRRREVAYAFSGTPSPTDEPLGKFGQRPPPPARRESASAAAAASKRSERLTRRLLATSGAGRPSAGTTRAVAVVVRVHRRPARCRASGSRGRARPSGLRARRGGEPPRVR